MPNVKCNLPWVESPFFEKELQQSNLSDEDKAFVKEYADNGFVVIDPKIDDLVIEGLKRGLSHSFDELLTQSKQQKLPANLINRIQDAWTFNEHVKEIAASQYIMDKLRLLYRRRPIPFQTLNFNVGTQQRTHSDMIHFSSMPERFMCGVWMALEDVHEDNGPLHYYPKSHKLPFYSMSDMYVKGSASKKMKNGYMDYTDFYEDFITAVIDSQGLEKKTLTIEKGKALIWSANLLHGGEKINQPGSTRHSQVTHYYFEDCVYYTPLFSDLAIKKIYMRDILDIATGERIPNKYLGDVVKSDMNTTLKRRVQDMMPKPLLALYHSLKGK